MDDKLYIGLDVGTDSVGWAATDGNFKLKRIKGKTAWGSRIFEEAKSAEERRMLRAGRRRLARRKNRLNILDQTIGKYITEQDPTFFIRLHDSAFRMEDKAKEINDCKYPLFPSYEEEKEYYKKYPTIWHLRLALIKGEKDAFSDNRLIYLAIHHIVKYRGNFLREGNISVNQLDDGIFAGINKVFAEIYENENPDDEEKFELINSDKFEAFRSAVDNFGQGNKKENKEALKKCVNKDESIKQYLELFCSLCVGGTFNSSKLGEEYEKKEITLDGDFDSNVGEYTKILGDRIDLVYLAKIIFDYSDLREILNGSDYLSQAFVNIYAAHKEEKKALKRLCHSIDEKCNLTGNDSVYYQIFKRPDLDSNYPAFVHDIEFEGKRITKKRPKIHDFNAFIVKEIEPYANLMTKDEALAWNQLKFLAEKDQLLQTIAINSTSVIPMQLHLKELNAIIENGKKFGVGWLGENENALIDIFKFRIPYYCGPLNPNSAYSNVCFVEGEAKEKITPSNFSKKIDLAKSREKFIGSLVNKCTYLRSENVLPRQSLLYEEFDTLNKVNAITINSQVLSKEEKETILEIAFRSDKTTFKGVCRSIKKLGEYYKTATISGMSEEDYLSCQSHAFFTKDPFNFDLSDRNSDEYKLAEEIIRVRTSFTDSPNDAIEYIHKKYPNLNDRQLKAIKGFAPTGWASLCRKMVTLPYFDEDGEGKGFLIDIMRSEPRTFMSIYNDRKYHFKETVNYMNGEAFGSLSKKDQIEEIIESMPPKMRRSTIQAYRIVDEISRFGKRKPDAICIEFSRAEDKNKKGKYTEDRKKKISAFLANLSKNIDEKQQTKHIAQELKDIGIDKLRGKHLYLYFLQNGRDAYTGNPIDINDVLNGNGYDTDHIIPQSFIKDDSLDNLVLVKREINQSRKNEYPIPAEIRNNAIVQSLWQRLHKSGMMSDKKYRNLIRSVPLREDELSGFVNAQLTSMNWSNKALADILKIAFPEASIVYSRAMYASLVRKELFIPKLRDLNDTHHAVDAYLNIITGISLNGKFGDMRLVKAIVENAYHGGSADDKYSINMEKYIERMVINKDGTPTKFGDEVLKTSQRHDFLLTYRRSYSDGGYYDQTLYSPYGDKKSLIPSHTKQNNPMSSSVKYGGFSGCRIESSVPITIFGKKKTKYLYPLKHYCVDHFYGKTDLLQKEIESDLKSGKSEKVSIDFKHIIYNDTKTVIHGIPCLVSSSDEDVVIVKPVKPLFLDLEFSRYLHQAFAIMEKYPDILKEESNGVEIEINRFSKKPIEVSHAKNSEVATFLLQQAGKTVYEFVPMIHDIAISFNNGDDLLTNNGAKSLYSELEIIKSLVALFGRKSMSLCKTFKKNRFRVSRGKILEFDFAIVNDSVTGLVSSVTKI